MRSVILSIGDELLIGQVINTNAAYLGEKVLALNIPPDKIISLSDNKEDILNAIDDAFRNYELVIITGGLGPTHDDITKSCIAEYFNVKLVENKKVLSHIRSIYKRRKMKTPSTVNIQAMVPRGCRVLFNRAGTAPGILFERKKKIIAVMPGVPHEVYYIWEKQLEPVIRKKFSTKKIILVKTIHTIGITESLLSKKIGSIDELKSRFSDAELSLAFLPSNYEVRLRFTVKTESKKKAQSVMRSVINFLNNRAGEYIYSFNAEPLSKVIGDFFRTLNLKLAVAESCTGGLISSRITDIAGSADFFQEGFVTYSNESKKRILKVKENTLKSVGAVSENVAKEMAEGARKIAKADIGLSTTGLAGPGGATPEKPVGIVWIGYSDKDITFAEKFIFTKDRMRNKDIMTKMALEILRRQLLRIKND
jgi:nicotinamide-nucleotide amidase